MGQGSSLWSVQAYGAPLHLVVLRSPSTGSHVSFNMNMLYGEGSLYDTSESNSYLSELKWEEVDRMSSFLSELAISGM